MLYCRFGCRWGTALITTFVFLLSTGSWSFQKATAHVTPTIVPLTHSGQHSLDTSQYGDLASATRYLADQNLPAAEEALQDAIEKNPNSVIAFYNLGHIYELKATQSKNLDDYRTHNQAAEMAYERVILLDSSLLIAYFKLGRLAIDREDYDHARSIYEKAIAVAPNNAALYFNVAGVYDTQQDYDAAITLYKKAIAIDPNFVYAYNNLGLVLELVGQKSEAENTYRQVLALQPDYAFARLNLGNLLAERAAYDEATAEYQYILSVDPAHPWANLYLGNVLFQKGDYEAALKAYQRVEQNNPGYTPIHYFKAMVSYKLNRPINAIESANQYLKLSPNGDYTHEVNSILRVLQVEAAQVELTPQQDDACLLSLSCSD